MRVYTASTRRKQEERSNDFEALLDASGTADRSARGWRVERRAGRPGRAREAGGFLLQATRWRKLREAAEAWKGEPNATIHRSVIP